MFWRQDRLESIYVCGGAITGEDMLCEMCRDRCLNGAREHQYEDLYADQLALNARAL